MLQKPLGDDRKFNQPPLLLLLLLFVLFSWSQIRVLVILVTYRRIILYLRWRLVCRYILMTKSTTSASATRTASFGHQFRV